MSEPPKKFAALRLRQPQDAGARGVRHAPDFAAGEVQDDSVVMTYPEGLFRAAVAMEILAIVLVVISLIWDAPLEQLADPMHTPNPAKAPWYFLGLQELLHYFPPFVAGVLIPTLVVVALVVIPYFNINVESEGDLAQEPRQADESLRRRSDGVFNPDGRVRRLGRADPNAADRVSHAAGGRPFAGIPWAIPALAGVEIRLVLDHDLVSGAGSGTDHHRNSFPRSGMVVGVAMAELNHADQNP